MDDEQWLVHERREAGPCPSCGADAARPIVYGMPLDDTFERLAGRVVFAGCCLPEVMDRFQCVACQHRWGLVAFGET